ncbi:MAG: hypothetical protein JWM82_2293 [Myxococcales bacterium]|jgi:hypothetical protein|nr:hypothetical protein [Myxococcales bacterium]
MRKELFATRRSRAVGGPALALVAKRDETAEEMDEESSVPPSAYATRTASVWSGSALGVALSSAGAGVTSRTMRSQQSASDTVVTGAAFVTLASSPSQQQALNTSPVIRQRSPAPLVAVARASSGKSKAAAKNRERRLCEMARMKSAWGVLKYLSRNAPAGGHALLGIFEEQSG